MKNRDNLDKGGRKCGTLFVDLSKSFCCPPHDLLAKLNAYGFVYKYIIKLISSFPSNKKYKTKINSSFSYWEHLIGVQQGSDVGLSVFNVVTPWTQDVNRTYIRRSEDALWAASKWSM